MSQKCENSENSTTFLYILDASHLSISLLRIMSTPTVLITGGCGYLGIHIARELRRTKKADKVILYDLVAAGLDQNDEGFEFVQGDVCDVVKLKNVLECFRVSGVIHAAGYGLSGTTNLPAYDDITRRVNVLGTESVIEACKACGVKALGIYEILKHFYFIVTALCFKLLVFCLRNKENWVRNPALAILSLASICSPKQRCF